MLESFLLHYRNLRDFFSPANTGDDDITVAEFLEAPSPESEPWTEVAPREKERLNRALAHPSHSRIEYEKDKKWPIGDMTRAVIERLEKFLARLPEDRRQWFEQSAAVLQSFRNVPPPRQ